VGFAVRHRSLAALALLVLLAGCTRVKTCAYEGDDRDEWQKPDQVVEALALEPGDTVADLGSGSGYFTFRLAEAVGAGGRVYAVDVDEAMNERLAELAAERGFANVEVVLAAADDPRLPEGAVDLVFTSNTYHHLEDRAEYFARLAPVLGPEGRIAVIEYRGQGFFQRVFPHYTPEETIRAELERAGYRLLQSFDFLPRQSFLVFGRRADDAPDTSGP
jgi:arsenite methyltransferase